MIEEMGSYLDELITKKHPNYPRPFVHIDWLQILKIRKSNRLRKVTEGVSGKASRTNFVGIDVSISTVVTNTSPEEIAT